MSTVRAKFKCESVTNSENGKSVKLNPVYGGSEENERFFSFTPYGSIEIGTVNENINFEPGKEYFVDFIEA